MTVSRTNGCGGGEGKAPAEPGASARRQLGESLALSNLELGLQFAAWPPRQMTIGLPIARRTTANWPACMRAWVAIKVQYWPMVGNMLRIHSGLG